MKRAKRSPMRRNDWDLGTAGTPDEWRLTNKIERRSAMAESKELELSSETIRRNVDSNDPDTKKPADEAGVITTGCLSSNTSPTPCPPGGAARAEDQPKQ